VKRRVAAGDAPFGRHAVYLEVGGSSYHVSINYEWRARQELSLGTGLGGLQLCGEGCTEVLTLPILAHVLVGPGDHLLELGAGPVPVVGRSVGLAWIAGAIGYRYQRTPNGFLLRLAYTPLWLATNKSQELRHWAGVSVGATF
jgi:hypothetical protein